MSEAMNELPEELRVLERKLAGLSPTAAGLSREEVLFEAGRAAGGAVGGQEAAHARRGRAFWRGACAAMLLVNVGIVALRPVKTVEVVRREPAGEATLVREMPRPTPGEVRQGVTMEAGLMPWRLPEEAGAEDRADYLGLRQRTLDMGIGAAMLMADLASAEVREAAAPRPVQRPQLRPVEGVDAAPAWQRRVAGLGGERS
jgi:hypothetical protein